MINIIALSTQLKSLISMKTESHSLVCHIFRNVRRGKEMEEGGNGCEQTQLLSTCGYYLRLLMDHVSRRGRGGGVAVQGILEIMG